MIGNLYTASLYLGFRSALEFEFQKGVDLKENVLDLVLMEVEVVPWCLVE